MITREMIMKREKKCLKWCERRSAGNRGHYGVGKRNFCCRSWTNLKSTRARRNPALSRNSGRFQRRFPWKTKKIMFWRFQGLIWIICVTMGKSQSRNYFPITECMAIAREIINQPRNNKQIDHKFSVPRRLFNLFLLRCSQIPYDLLSAHVVHVNPLSGSGSLVSTWVRP